MLKIEIKPNILDRKRKLVISADMITYDDSDWKDVPNTIFNKDEVEGLRFGIESIKGYAFTIGRRYYIDIRGFDDKVIKIRFTSLYSIRKKELHKRYIDILNALFNTHQENIINRYIDSFNKNSFVEILGTTFKSDTVIFIKDHEIPYSDLGFREYIGYYALFSKSNPKIYKSYNYLKDWNSSVVYTISKLLLAES